MEYVNFLDKEKIIKIINKWIIDISGTKKVGPNLGGLKPPPPSPPRQGMEPLKSPLK